MKAIVISENLPGIDALQVDNDASEPKPTKDQVLVEIKAAALNFFDVLQLQGKYQIKPQHPFTLGAEFAGVITSDPDPDANNFMGFSKGDKVFGYVQGAFAEKAAVDLGTMLPMPSNMTFEQASSLFITYPTSYAALVTRANVQPGEVVLVHAAGGGVGLAAVQIAKALGATVIATASTQEKLDVVKSRAGADHGVLYGRDGWQKEVLKITKGKGVDVVYDPVGLIVQSLKCIAWNGRLLVVGFAAGDIEKVPTNLILLKNISIVGIHWGAYQKNEPGAIPEVWGSLMDLLESGKVTPILYDKIYSGLEEIPKGLKALTSRQTFGKVVAKIPGGSSKL